MNRGLHRDLVWLKLILRADERESCIRSTIAMRERERESEISVLVI